MKIKHKNIFHEKSATPSRNAAGFSLVEVLVSIVITGILSVLVSYSLNFMLSSNQKLAKEENRRVELNRALEMINNDVRMSQKVSKTLPTGMTNPLGSDDTLVLYLEVPKTTSTDTDKVMYYLKTTGNKREVYRRGVIPDANGSINSSTVASVLIAREIANTVNSAVAATACDRDKGFYACVTDNQATVSIAGNLGGGNSPYEATQTIVARATETGSTGTGSTGTGSTGTGSTGTGSTGTGSTGTGSTGTGSTGTGSTGTGSTGTGSTGTGSTGTGSTGTGSTGTGSTGTGSTGTGSTGTGSTGTGTRVCLEYAGKSGTCKTWSY
jgi:prepilin-type N-terminal cleavage/methylation domain-containing protein